MSTPWKGKQEEFSNVFHYICDPFQDSDASLEELADAVVSELRQLHTSGVKMVRVRVHGPTDQGAAADVMRVVKDLTGTGTGTAGSSLAPELAVVAQLYVGRGPNGGKQILRKFIHSTALIGGGGTVGEAQGTSPLTAGVKDFYTPRLNALKNLTVAANQAQICTPKGKGIPLGSEWTINDYVSTRQFRRRGKRARTTV